MKLKEICENTKTEKYWSLQGNYGQGWEEVTVEDTQQEANQRIKEYRENEPGVPFRLVRKKTKTIAEAKVNKLDPETEKHLEQTLVKLASIKDMDEAKKIAHDFLNSMKFQEKAEKYKRLVDRARSVKEVIKFVYDVKLAGEGLGVIR